MPLTADDVRTKQFRPARIGRRGYDEGEVDDFLDEVIRTLAEHGVAAPGLTEPVAQPAGASADEPGSGPEAATGLLALAERTAQQHVAAGEAAAAELLAAARREADALLGDAQRQARRLLAEAEETRRDALASVYREQEQAIAATAALRAGADRAQQHLQAYLHGLLVQVRSLALDAPAELTAVPA